MEGVKRKRKPYFKISCAVMGTMLAVPLVMGAVYYKNPHVYDNVSRIAVWPFCAVLGLWGSVAVERIRRYREYRKVGAVRLSIAEPLLNAVRDHLDNVPDPSKGIEDPLYKQDPANYDFLSAQSRSGVLMVC